MNSAAGPTPVVLEDVTALIRRALANRRDLSPAFDEDTRIEDLDLSSLQLADVVFRLEEQKGLRFDGGDLSELRTLGELVELANRRLVPS